jgi:hypothetical protein
MSTRLTRRTVTGVGATLAVMAGIGAFAPTAAQAAPYNGTCGSGYGVIDALSLEGQGTVYLTYNGSSGKNCVVTVRNNPGARKDMSARISLAGKPWIEDTGNFTTYAGPVYVSARDKCIDWGGWIGNAVQHQFGTHCG